MSRGNKQQQQQQQQQQRVICTCRLQAAFYDPEGLSLYIIIIIILITTLNSVR
jgi:hypothetical protein